jgi:hypothetical protein
MSPDLSTPTVPHKPHRVPYENGPRSPDATPPLAPFVSGLLLRFHEREFLLETYRGDPFSLLRCRSREEGPRLSPPGT